MEFLTRFVKIEIVLEMNVFKMKRSINPYKGTNVAISCLYRLTLDTVTHVPCKGLMVHLCRYHMLENPIVYPGIYHDYVTAEINC